MLLPIVTVENEMAAQIVTTAVSSFLSPSLSASALGGQGRRKGGENEVLVSPVP